jgi:hypothetical protein
VAHCENSLQTFNVVSGDQLYRYYRFDLHIVDRKGAENPVVDNLSRLENISFDPIPVNDSFPNE